MRIEFPSIRQQLEDYQHALLKHGTAEQILRPVDSRMARRMGYTLEGLKAAVARGDIRAGKRGRCGAYFLTPAVEAQHTRQTS